ncbi:MAG: 2-C-methyl-D-erythritol 4-phosphate cytidylyltransferase [Acidimicrobiia bacterium]
MTAWGVVVAAGEGRRFGAPKASIEMAGRQLWQWARQALLDGGCVDVVVVGPVQGGIPGGNRRRDSVAAGLAAVPEVEFVLVHDAARPVASSQLTERVLRRLQRGDADAVVPAIPLADTVKEIEDERVRRTPNRATLLAVQTPQGFRRSRLIEAHAATSEEASDDAVLIERIGGVVAVVEGEVGNIKITYPTDLQMAEALLT